MVEVIVYAVLLLIGAFAALLICLCADATTYIQSRGSTLISRDTSTRTQTELLRQSLKREGLLNRNSPSLTSVAMNSKKNTAVAYSEEANHELIEEIPLQTISPDAAAPSATESSFTKHSSSPTEVNFPSMNLSPVSSRCNSALNKPDSEQSGSAVIVSVHLSNNQFPPSSPVYSVRSSKGMSRCKVARSQPEHLPNPTYSTQYRTECTTGLEEDIKESFLAPSNFRQAKALKSKNSIFLAETARNMSFVKQQTKSVPQPCVETFTSNSVSNIHPTENQLPCTLSMTTQQIKLNNHFNKSPIAGTSRGTPILYSALHGSGIRQRVSPYSGPSTPSPSSLSSSSHSGSRNHRTTLEDIKEDISCSEEDPSDGTKTKLISSKRNKTCSDGSQSTSTQKLPAHKAVGSPSKGKLADKSASKINKRADVKKKPKTHLQSPKHIS